MDAQQLAKRKKINKKTLIILGSILAVFFIIGLLNPKPSTATAPATPVVESAEVTKQKTLEAAFSSWDGSHRNLVKYLKENMNDPGSFDHVETRYWKWGQDSLVIKMKYRGKNGFGALVLQNVRAVAHVDGTVGSVDFGE